MFMDSQCVGVEVGFVEHDVIGPREFSVRGCVDAEAENVPIIHSVGIGITDEEGSYACAGAIEVFLLVLSLRCGCCHERIVVRGK